MDRLTERVSDGIVVNMGEEEVLRYLFLVDRKLTIIMSGVNWQPEYDEELKSIDVELAHLRVLVDTEHAKKEAENVMQKIQEEAR